ncbi:hypothetical protein ACOSQ4_029357 [Xanthoceras sorbifolium]
MDDIAPPLGAVPSVGRVRAKVLRRCSTKAETSIAMPTFVLVKRGKEMDRVVGAKKDELEKKIQKHRAS